MWSVIEKLQFLKSLNVIFIFRRFRKHSLRMGLAELMLLHGSEGDPSKGSMGNIYGYGFNSNQLKLKRTGWDVGCGVGTRSSSCNGNCFIQMIFLNSHPPISKCS